MDKQDKQVIEHIYAPL